MARTGDSPGPDHRREARYPTRHRVEGEPLDGGVAFRGTLQDLSAAGCCLRLDGHVSLGTQIELRCDISGLGLRISGRVVWAEETAAGVFHGIALAGYESDEDALFHRLYVGRLARRQRRSASAPKDP